MKTATPTLTERQVLTLLAAIGRQEDFLNDRLDQTEEKQPEQVSHWQQRLADLADAKNALEEFLAPLPQDASGGGSPPPLDKPLVHVQDALRRAQESPPEEP